MNSNVISKVVGLVLNLRSLGFNAGGWDDLEAATGQLSPVDKDELGKALTNAGAEFRGKVWVFKGLDTDALMATPVSSGTGEVKLVSIIAKVPMGVWGKDAAGRVRFIKDPHFIPSLEDTDESDEDEDEDTEGPASRFDSPRKGKLTLDL